MKKFQSIIAPLVQEYIFYRQASDRWNDSSYEPNLILFDRYCMKTYPNAKGLSQEMVDKWCCQRDMEQNNSCRSRIYPVVSFIRYLKKRGKTDIVIPVIPRKLPRTYIPHSFTNKELHNFFKACDNISGEATPEQRLRRITIPVFFRLLYSSGIRTTEARLLRTEDVDLNGGILNVRYSVGSPFLVQFKSRIFSCYAQSYWA